MTGYGAFSDDFYVNMNLSTEMQIPQGRETLLHYFEQVRRRYPKMQNFYARETGDFVLEEEKTEGAYRWVATEQKRINSGAVNPESFESALEQHRCVLDLIPYELSVSPLDCESLSVMLGFDYTCRGNQNEILAEAIGVPRGLERFLQVPYGKLLCNEPSITFALDEECRTQCRVSCESRTNAYQIRTGDFSDDQVSVYLTVRRYDSLGVKESYVDEFDRLAALCQDLADEYLVPNVLRPLQERISLS